MAEHGQRRGRAPPNPRSKEAIDYHSKSREGSHPVSLIPKNIGLLSHPVVFEV